MGALIGDITKALIGTSSQFSIIVWFFVTTLIVFIGPFLVQVAPTIYTPVARSIAVQPEKVMAWSVSFIAVVCVALLIAMATAIFAAPLLVILFMWILCAGFVGYFATAYLLGEKLLIKLELSNTPKPWMATAVGLLVVRLVRLIPFIGGPIHAIFVLAGFGAASAMSWKVFLSWHKRRMPDAKQFDGETLIEWYPDGDPQDGKPAINTGRPIIGNLRGDEDKLGKDHQEDEDSEQ